MEWLFDELPFHRGDLMTETSGVSSVLGICETLLRARGFCWYPSAGYDFRDLLYLTKTIPGQWEPKHEWRRYPESPCNPSVFVHTGAFRRSLNHGSGNLAELYRLRPGEVVWGLPQHHIFELIHGHREWADEMKRGGWPCRDFFPTAIQFEGLQSWEGPGREPGVCVLKATYFSRQCGHVSRMLVLTNISNRSFFDAVLRGMALHPEAVIGVSSPCDGEERASDECFEWAARSGARYFYSDVDSGGKLRELIHADGRYAEVGFIKEHHWMPREDVCCWMRQEEDVGKS